MISKIFCVEPCDNGKRIDVFLTAEPELSEFTRSGIKHLIEEGLVKDNDKVITRAGWIIKTGDIIDVIPKPHEVLAFAEKENIPLDIIYEDDAIAVVNKPQGMTVHPAVGNYHGTLANALLYHMSSTSDINGPIRPGIVHRIDKDTSGLLVVAKNNQSHVALATQIQNKTCKRTYLAVVEGVIAQDTGTIDKPIARDKKDRLKMAVDNMGKHAVTHYTILERFKENTLVQFDLETGRTHQIRV
ncbi:MAG: RluA family pseudouridine synthase, partial [Clostridia bacterium]